MKHIGSDGSGCFGSPRSILSQNGVQRFLVELKAFRNGETTSPRPSLIEIPLYSVDLVETEDDENEDRHHEEGHMTFATQAPRGRKPKILKESLLDAGKPYSIPSPNGECSSDEMARDGSGQLRREGYDYTRQTLGQKQLGTLENREPEKLLKAILPAPKTSAQALIALLTNKPGTNDAQFPPITLNEAVSPNKPATVQKDPIVPVRSNLEKGLVIDVDTIIKNDVTEAHSALPSVTEITRSADQTDSVHVSDAITANNLGVIPPPPVEIDALSAVDDAEENAQSRHDVDELNSNVVQDIGVTKVEFIEDPWQGITRIRRRDILVSKSQQDLIDRKDCWIPPEPGVRRPTANLPVPILQAFTAMIDGVELPRRTDENTQSKATNSPVRSPTGSASPVVADQCPDNEEDLQGIPFSSGEWPPSSPPTVSKRGELPPDSSSSLPSPEALVYDEALSPQSEHGFSLTEVTSTLISHGSVGFSNVTKDLSFNRASEEIGNDTKQSDERCSEHGQVMWSTTDPVKALESDSRISPSKLNKDHGVVVTNTRSGVKYQDQEATQSELPFPQMLDDHPSYQIQRNCSTLSGPNPIHRGIESMIIDVDSDTNDDDSSQSEMETTIPGALEGHGADLNRQKPHHTPRQNGHRQYPTLQVDRTPYTLQHERKTKLIVDPGQPVDISECLNEKHDEPMRDSLVDNASSAQIMVPGTFSATHSMELAIDDSTCAWKAPQSSVEVSQNEKITGQAMKNRLKSAMQKAPGADAQNQVNNKREVEEIADTFFNVTKRRKRQKSLSGTTSEVEEITEDPSIKARQHRREFLNALRALPHIAAAPLTPVQSDGDTKLYEDSEWPLVVHCRKEESDEHIEGKAVSGQLPTSAHSSKEPTSPAKVSSPARLHVLSPHFHAQKKDNLCPLKPGILTSHPEKSDSLSLFHRFQHAYPQYKGNENHFISMCRKIGASEKCNRMEHKSLWDDFVIRHQMEYREHLLKCTEEAEDPMPYELFYRQEIDGPQFMQRVLTPDNVAQILLVGSETRLKSPVRLSSDRIKAIDLTHSHASDVEALHKLPPNGVPLANFEPKEYASEELVSGAQPNFNHSCSIQNKQRTLPWSEKNLNKPTSSSVRDKATSANSIPPAKDPTATPKSRTRTRASPGVQAAATSKRAASPMPPIEPILAARPPPSESKYTTVIRSEHTSNAVLNTNPRLIVKTSRSPPTPSIPLAKKLKSSVDFTSPLRETGRNKTSGALPSTSGLKPWYLDPVNPFKSFARAEASIIPGNGNGFVEEKQGRPIVGRQLVIENGVVIAPKKRIDVLGWHL